MKTIALATLALALLLQAPATSAQATGYMTVDAVAVSGSILKVTGIAQGQAAATTVEFSGSFYAGLDAAAKAASLEACHRMLVLALSKPGQYLAKVSMGSCEVALVKP